MDEKTIKIIRITAWASGLFTLFIGVIMIMGFLQLRQVDPLDNPSLVKLKEQYDADPNNQDLREQVRALDLMSRRAFFATRWQIETGTWLLIIGGVVFILSQRLLTGARRKRPDIPGEVNDLPALSRKERSYLLAGATIVVILAFVVSQVMRAKLPDPLRVEEQLLSEGVSDIASRPVQAQSVQAPLPNDNVNETETDISGEAVIEEPVAGSAETASETMAVTTASSGSTSIPNFPFFRGEGGRGIVKGKEFPVDWDGKSGRNILWKTEIPTPGYSSPVVWENRIFLTGAIGNITEVYCFDRLDGKLLWTAPATGVEGEPETPPKTSEDTGLAAPTAATNGKVVTAIFATGNLVCLDMEGKRLWAKNLGVPDNHYGHSSSLIIYNNTLLVQYDHFKKKSLIALDLNTGKQLWETPRQVAISWASPVIARFNGKDQVILTSEPLVISYDITTGKEIWSAMCMSGEVGPSVAVNSKYVFAVNDFARLVAIDPAKGGEIVWEDNEFTPEVASPVATEQWVYVLTSWGAVACYNTDTGNLAWSHDFDYGFYASPIIVDDKVYMLDKAGVMHIVQAEGEFRLISEPALGERANSTPAFYDKMIYIRTDKYLYSIGK